MKFTTIFDIIFLPVDNVNRKIEFIIVIHNLWINLCIILYFLIYFHLYFTYIL
ncbi:protein of unknown function [Tepidibacter aestuarii]|nr:protein of unknown function [Tepidibacter aestuarii]